MIETRIDLLRHGEPEGGSRYRGSSIDDPLTERGWQQMRQGVGSAEGWDLIITSPMRRCVAFSEALGEERGLPVKVDAAFREIGFGAWEGKTKQQLRSERLKEFNAFYADPVANTPENAEPVAAFFERISSAYEAVVQEQKGKRVLVVAHAGVVRASITHVLQAPVSSMYRLEIHNGRISRCRHATGHPLVEGINLAFG
ncbi:MAG: histidine phosphatase family protein [bacterium]